MSGTPLGHRWPDDRTADENNHPGYTSTGQRKKRQYEIAMTEKPDYGPDYIPPSTELVEL